MIDVFKEISGQITAQDAARLYGITFDHKGRALCPFHNDTHPSMSFRNGRFRCWSCDASGDAIDFTALLFGLDLMETVSKLDADFHLGLTLDRPPTKAERERAARWQRLRADKQLFKMWRLRLANQLDRCCRVANTALARMADDLTDTETLAIQYNETLAYWSDTLAFGITGDAMTIFQFRKEVHILCSRILKSTQMKSGQA